jgi:hypothetical protein
MNHHGITHPGIVYKQLAAVLKDKLLPRCRFSVPSKNNRHDTFL